jgi:hypothetical protein
LKTNTGNSFVSSFINCRLLPEASDTPQNLIPRRKRRPSDQLRRSSLDGGTGGHTRRRRTLALEMLLLLLLRSKNAGQGDDASRATLLLPLDLSTPRTPQYGRWHR